MKTFKLIVLIFLCSFQLFAQESIIKGKIAASGIIAGRGKVILSITHNGNTTYDSCLFGLDSSYIFKAKLKGFSLIEMRYEPGAHYLDSYLLLPGESLNLHENTTEAESEFAAKVLSRGNNLFNALEAFEEFDNAYNYGLLDSIAFNEKLLAAKEIAIEAIKNGQDTLPPNLLQLALNSIELKSAEIYLNYAYLGRFQQKTKTLNAVSPWFIEPIKQVSKLDAFPNTEFHEIKTKINDRLAELVKVNFETEKLSPAYKILNHSFGMEVALVMHQVFPKSDGPNCNYGYAAAAQGIFIHNDFYEEGSSAPEGWLISPQFERAFEFKKDGYAIVLDGMHYKLINVLGQTVLQNGFEDLIYYDSGIYIARKYDKYGLIYADGKAIIDYQYQALNPLGNDLFAFRFTGSPFMGMIDIKGNEIVKPKYGYIKPFDGREYAITVVFDDKKWTPNRINGNKLKMPGEKFGVIDRNGKEIMQPGWYSIVPQSHSQVQNFPLVVYKRTYNSLFRKFRIANDFQMLAQTGTLYAWNKRYPSLNLPGKQYYFASNLSESVLRKTDGSVQSKPFRLDYNGLSSIGDDYFIVRIQDKYDLLLKDASGALQIDTFQSIEQIENNYDYEYNENNANNSLFRLIKDNCQGIINSNGKVVLPSIYDDIESFDSLLVVSFKDKFAVFDTTGKQLTPFAYDKVYIYSDVLGLLAFEKEGSTQICDRSFKVIFEAPAKDIWLDGASSLEICNWSYLKDGLLWQYNRQEHVLPFKDTLHYRYLTMGGSLSTHIVNKNGRWLGTREFEETINESEPLLVSRFGEQVVVDLKNNYELKGNFTNIKPLYYNKGELNYTSSSYKSDDQLARFYLFTTNNGLKGLSNAAFKWVLDTTFKDIEVSASFIAARKEKQVQLFDLSGKKYFDKKFSSRRGLSILADNYIRIQRIFGGFRVYNKKGEQLIKSKKGYFNLTPKGNIMVNLSKSNRIMIYDTLGNKILKEKVLRVSKPQLGLIRVKSKKHMHFMTLEGEIKSNWALNRNGWPIIPEFVSWLDTTGSMQQTDVDSNGLAVALGFEAISVQNANDIVMGDYDGNGNSSGSADIWLPNASKLRVEPKLAAAFVMAQWMSLSYARFPDLIDLNSNYINIETATYNDGTLIPSIRSYYLQNDSIFPVIPNLYFDSENGLKFARLLTDKMGTDESINWNVCVKQEELFNFLSPEFRLTETGIEVIIRSLKVQNTKTNEIKMALSKEEVLPYLVPSTHFYHWFKKR